MGPDRSKTHRAGLELVIRRIGRASRRYSLITLLHANTWNTAGLTLDVHAALPMLDGVVRQVGGYPGDGDEGAVQDDKGVFSAIGGP